MPSRVAPDLVENPDPANGGLLMRDQYAQSPVGDRRTTADVTRQPILILGGTSLVAAYLVPRIVATSVPLRVAARRLVKVPANVEFLPFDALATPGWHLGEATIVLSLLPLPALIPVLPRLRGASTIVALSSTSRLIKMRSADATERSSARSLAQAEDALARWCDAHGTSFTVLRPTLVYDMVRDRNLARMAKVVRRFGVLPLARPARGLRQPIHADDVGRAMLAAIDHTQSDGLMLNIAGGERLSYRTMAERVFVSQGRQPRLLLIPTSLLRFAFAVARRLGLIRGPVTAAAFDRMNQDLVFDTDDGSALLGLKPRPFDPAGPTRPGDLDARTIGDPSVRT